MPAEFSMPGDPEELWSSDSSLPLKVVDLIEFEGSQRAGDVAEEIAFRLCDEDPLCIVEQSVFDATCSLVRAFDILEGPKRRQLVDALCSSITCLNAWIDRILGSPPDSQDRELLVDHRSAFKAYLFFLQWIVKISSREAKESMYSVTTSSTAGLTGKGRRKKNVDEVNGEWDWTAQLPKIMKSIGRSLNADLWALFRPNRPDQNVLGGLIHLAAAALEQPCCAKDEELASAIAHVLVVTALKYQQLDAVAGALVDALNKYEHTPTIIAETLRYSIDQYDDGRLAAAVIADVAAVDPGEYERQQNATGEKAGVRSIASFVEEMSSRLPKFMLGQISLLLPHLGGKAWSLRCSIVSAVGHLLHQAFDGEVANAEGAALRLRSKQHLLDILCQRIRDQSSFVRKNVLQTWAFLAEHCAIPLGHWQVVTATAAGRLEDKSSLVRKEALKLLGALMLHNPFGPALPLDRFVVSLQVHREMLQQILPSQGGDDGFQPTQEVVIEENAENEDISHRNVDVSSQHGDAEEIAPKDEPMEGDEGNLKPMKTEAEENSETDDANPVENATVTRASKTPAEVGWDGTVEELQALVASLELAVDFAKSLSGCMPTLVQLLASSTVSDVQESIAMLLTCKQFEIAGAPEAIRKMLPLVFSRDQAIKDRIVEALDQLYVSGWAGNTFTSAQAARNLVDLASGATLGELGSLEEVVKEFMNRSFVTTVTLHELWELANKAGAALAAGIGGARACRDLRAALAVISMAIAVKPESVSEREIAALLRLGFPGGYPADALTARHACAALLHLETNFKAGSFGSFEEPMFAAFVRTIVASPLKEETWYSAVESAINALYALHPAPEHMCAAIVRILAADAFPFKDGHDALSDEERTRPALGGEDGSLSVQSLSRFFFVLSHVALKHLVLIEKASKSVRRARFDAEKKASEGKPKSAASGNEDLNAELGVGSAAADAELDAMKEAAEIQILAARSLLGPYAKIVSAVCHNRQLLTGDASLRSSALLALCKLMIVDPSMCNANLQLLFTLLHNRGVEPELRSNLVIALGDLALRFPNALEPWTDHIYRPLGDPDAGVRKNTLMVLSHLILNDMMKVKGHIAKVAVCLEDPQPRIAALAQLFFHELAKKEYKGTSPIYNLLPDILSNLSRESGLTRAQFQSVMQQLLSYIKKDRQGDALVEKLCGRLASTQDASQWRNVAFCLAQLPISEKGTRKLAECFKLYKAALADAEVTETIVGILSKAKKNTSKQEVKQLIEELEVKIEEAAAERAEEEATARRAQEDMAARAENDAPSPEAMAVGEAASQREGTEPSPPAIRVKQEDQETEYDIKVENEGQKVGAFADEGAPQASQRTRSRRNAAQESNASSVRQSQIAEENDTTSRRSTRASQRNKSNEEISSNASHAVPPRRSARGRKAEKDNGSSKQEKGSKATAIIDSDGDSDDNDGANSRIAAVQAAIGNMHIKEEIDA